MSNSPTPAAARDLLMEQASRALASAFAQHRLQRMLAILEQVADEGLLEDDDSAFLAEVLATLSRTSALQAQHPELATLHRCALGLYDDIMTAAHAMDGQRAGACR